MSAVEEWLFRWLERRHRTRIELAQRTNHVFQPRRVDRNRCGFVVRDDGYSDPDYCNRPPEWHLKEQP